MVLNRHCLPELPGPALGLTYASWAGGLTAPAVGVFSAGYFLGTQRWASAPPFDHTSTRILCDDVLVLGGGATDALSSSDHLDIAALYI